jgi:hypothetical protein
MSPEKYIKEHAKPLKKSYKCDLSRLKNLMPYFGDLCLDEITSYHLVEYRKQRMLEKGTKRKTFVAPSTINRGRKQGQSKILTKNWNFGGWW